MFDIVLFGALCFVVGASSMILWLQLNKIDNIEDIWKLIGNFLGHAFGFEMTVAVMIFIAEFVFIFLGIV